MLVQAGCSTQARGASAQDEHVDLRRGSREAVGLSRWLGSDADAMLQAAAVEARHSRRCCAAPSQSPFARLQELKKAEGGGLQPRLTEAWPLCGLDPL